MNYTVIAEGEDINTIGDYEPLFLEGDYGEVRAFVTAPPTIAALVNMDQEILSSGVILTEPAKYDASIGAVVVRFRKQMEALQIIGLGLGALILVGAMVFAWQIAQSIGGGGPAAIWILLGVLGLVLFIKSTEGKAVVKAGYGAAKHVGRVYTERRMFIDRPTRGKISEEVTRYHEEEARRAARGAPYAGKATGYSPGEAGPSGSDITEEQ